jgi:hypothetical protein
MELVYWEECKSRHDSFKLLCQNLHGDTAENHENPRIRIVSLWEILNMKPEY